MQKGFGLVEVLVGAVIVLLIGAVVVGSSNKTVSPLPDTKKEIVLPEATGYVIDQSGVLSAENKQKIEETLKGLDSVAQVAVVTLKTTQPLDEKQYAIKLADKWKVGYKGKDNGIIFLVVTDDRKVRIEVGRGLEAVINDAKAGRILDDSVVPYLAVNDWNKGIMSGVEAIAKEVRK